MKLLRTVGATSQIFQIFIADSSSTTGAGLTGLTNASSSLTAYYHRDTDTTATAISLVTMTVGTFTSSGFKEIDATNMPGWYQFCPPNAALAAGAKSVAFHLKGATNMAPLPIEVDLDPQVDVTFWNGTAVSSPATAGIPDVNVKNINNAAAATPGSAGGILIAGSNAATTFATLTSTGAFTVNGVSDVAQTGDSFARIGANGAGLSNIVLPSGGLASVTAWSVAITGNITGNLSGSVGSVTGNVGGNVTGSVGSVVGAVGSVTGNVGGNVTGSVGSVVGAVGSVTGNVGGSVASVVGTVGSVTGNVGGSVASVVGNVGGNVTGTVASVVGNVGGNVTGTVAGVTPATDAQVTTATGLVPAAVLAAAASAPIAANIKKVNDTTVAGSGTTLDPWGPA